MKIVEALQDDNNYLRVSAGSRWLVSSLVPSVNGEMINGWIVYERKPYAKKTTIVLTTIIEDEAVKALLGDDEE